MTEALLITPTELRQWHYCPRVVFFERCTPVRRRETILMTHGREKHRSELVKERRRTLSRYDLAEGERRYDVRLKSLSLGLNGELDGKTVLTRVDINVPVENGRVTDATRLERIKPTIDAILQAGGKPLLLAHFGRPKGKVVDEMSLRHVVPALQQATGHSVQFIETLEGAEAPTAEAKAAEVLLLENIRFHPGEEANDPEFAARLAGLGDVFCNDAFSAAHRAHASTEALARLQALPSAQPVMAVGGDGTVGALLPRHFAGLPHDVRVQIALIARRLPAVAPVCVHSVVITVAPTFISLLTPNGFSLPRHGRVTAHNSS